MIKGWQAKKRQSLKKGGNILKGFNPPSLW